MKQLVLPEMHLNTMRTWKAKQQIREVSLEFCEKFHDFLLNVPIENADDLEIKNETLRQLKQLHKRLQNKFISKKKLKFAYNYMRDVHKVLLVDDEL